MKKSGRIIFGAIGILTIILIGIIVYMLFFSVRKVEKISNIEILDSYGNVIKNYMENKMPFTIKYDDSNMKIKVNGKRYEQGTRIYEQGTYNIEVDDGQKREKMIVEIKDIERKKESEYDIYVTKETLQTLFAQLNIANKYNPRGYIYTSKNKMLDIDYIKEKYPNMTISEYIGIADDEIFETQVVAELKEYVKEILSEDEDAYFNIYTEEYKFYLALELFGKIGLSDSRYSATIYSDGTLSYTWAANDYTYDMTKENKYEKFVEEKESYSNIVKQIRSNQSKYGNVLVSLLRNYDYMLISTLQDNAKYMLQYPELFVFKDKKIAKEMEKANIKKIVAGDEYNKLSEEDKNTFLKSIKLNSKELDEKYFNFSEGKYLVITGTKPFYGKKDKDEYQNIIKRVYEDYKDEYVILYKPHPSALPDAEQEEFLNSLQIKVLPGSIPMEAILFIYPNLKIGGFASSLYMSADKGKTEFFFENNKEELVKPLDTLYDQLFYNAKFYN